MNEVAKAQEPVAGTLIPHGEPESGPKLDAIRKLETLIPQVCQAVDLEGLTFHHFCEGLYVRQFMLPKGMIATGKIHKEQGFFLLVSGEVSATNDRGEAFRARAPFMVVTEPGTKRVVYAHEDSIMLTIHPNPDNTRDEAELEKRLIVHEDKPALPGPVIKLFIERKLP